LFVYLCHEANDVPESYLLFVKEGEAAVSFKDLQLRHLYGKIKYKYMHRNDGIWIKATFGLNNKKDGMEW